MHLQSEEKESLKRDSRPIIAAEKSRLVVIYEHPDVVAGVGTPVPGGVNFREAHYMLEQFAATQRMMSIEIAELNPLLDNCNQGAKNMIDLVASAFGKSIL